MIVKALDITNLRALSKATFEFKPGMNLLVGVNGVGKTTTLEALRICLSQLLPRVSLSSQKKENFSVEDIQINSKGLTISCTFQLNKQDYELLLQKQLESFVVKDPKNVGAKVINTPDIIKLTPTLPQKQEILKQSRTLPIGIFYSTRRSLVSQANPSKQTIAGGQEAAFADTLSTARELRLQEFAAWLDAQSKLANEKPQILKHVKVLKEAARSFLPDCQNLHVNKDKEKYQLLIEKHGKTIDVKQLSDGERGILALVLDLAKRLSQANPKLENPVMDGSAVVLIDEIDLHLHPKWQRNIVHKLEETFPNCQFIATTHSPQVIGEVEANRITIISKEVIYQPDQSFGLDSSRILEEMMDSDSRNEAINNRIHNLFTKIDEERFEEAKELIKQLQLKLGENDPEITRANTLISFLENEL